MKVNHSYYTQMRKAIKRGIQSPNLDKFTGRLTKILLQMRGVLHWGCGGPGRYLRVFPDDIFIVSYPKSGNTWLRFLVANLLHPDQNIGFDNIDEFVPDVYQCQCGDLELVNMKRPRVIKSHECLDPRYNKVIYIVRDPRDVVVSLYYFQKKQNLVPEDCSVSVFVHEFLSGKTAFGGWTDHVGGWTGARLENKNFLFIKYEDLISDFQVQLKKVADFLCVDDVSDKDFARIEAACNAENMKKIELITGHKRRAWKHSRKDIPFVRKAEPGGWAELLSEESVTSLEEEYAPLMERLKYNISTTK